MVFIHRFLPAGLILLLLAGSPVEAGKEDGRGQGRWRRAFASAIKDADTILGPESEMHFSFNLNPEQPQVLVGWSF